MSATFYNSNSVITKVEMLVPMLLI